MFVMFIIQYNIYFYQLPRFRTASCHLFLSLTFFVTVLSMPRRTRYALLILGVTALLPSAARAQQDEDPVPRPDIFISEQSGVEVRGDFQVGPTRFVLEMDPGESRTIEIQLTSREGESREYTLGVEDFAVTDDGTDSIQFFGISDGPFSARSWVKPLVSDIGLEHAQRAFIPVTISVPANASAGDHYSVVLFQREPKGEAAGGGFHLISRVGALLLITVKGDIVREGTLQQFSVSKPLYWSLPTQFTIQYKNTGTVHLVPTGSVQMKNIFGIPVDDIPVKDWYVLRNSIRKRDIFWQPKFALGRYTATLNLHSPGQPEPSVETVSFWVIPALPVIIALLAIFAVSFLVQAFMSHFEIRRKKE